MCIYIIHTFSIFTAAFCPEYLNRQADLDYRLPQISIRNSAYPFLSGIDTEQLIEWEIVYPFLSKPLPLEYFRYSTTDIAIDARLKKAFAAFRKWLRRIVNDDGIRRNTRSQLSPQEGIKEKYVLKLQDSPYN